MLVLEARDLRLNKVPNIKPESVGQRSAPLILENLDWYFIFS